MIKKIIKKAKRSFEGEIAENKVSASQAGSDGEILKMCRKCYSFGYAGGWHFERPEYLSTKDMDEEISIQFSQCPACLEESLAVYDMEYA